MSEVSFSRGEPGFDKLHPSLMVIYDPVVVAGSLNCAAPANEYNDENIFVLGIPFADLPRKVCGPVDPAVCAQGARRFVRAEIERIVAAGMPVGSR
jgi:hypothetical protein